MPRLPFYQVDAFAAESFGGNPAGVVPLDDWLADDVLQAIAAENNLPETAFVVPAAAGAAADFDLRWFTPTMEVDLCGHATLATAYTLTVLRGSTAARLVFDSRSGLLPVTRRGDVFTLDFPANPPEPSDDAGTFAMALGAEPTATLRAPNFGVAVFSNEDNVRKLSPDMARVAEQSDLLGLIATAPGRDVDVVSRFFAPQAGIPEDPVTGAAHTVLTPYWARRLGRSALTARQISARGGDLSLELADTRVRIGGHCALYLDGTIHV